MYFQKFLFFTTLKIKKLQSCTLGFIYVNRMENPHYTFKFWQGYATLKIKLTWPNYLQGAERRRLCIFLNQKILSYMFFGENLFSMIDAINTIARSCCWPVAWCVCVCVKPLHAWKQNHKSWMTSSKMSSINVSYQQLMNRSKVYIGLSEGEWKRRYHYHTVFNNTDELLNKWSELISKCWHDNNDTND